MEGNSSRHLLRVYNVKFIIILLDKVKFKNGVRNSSCYIVYHVFHVLILAHSWHLNLTECVLQRSSPWAGIWSWPVSMKMISKVPSAKTEGVMKYYFKTDPEASQLTKKAHLLSCLPPGNDMMPGVAFWMGQEKAEGVQENFSDAQSYLKRKVKERDRKRWSGKRSNLA